MRRAATNGALREPWRVGVRRGPVGRRTHFFPLVLFLLRPGLADTRSATHTATPCRRVFLFFCFALWTFVCSHRA
ncbi:hypothetical protein TCDM_13567 [Trypanosoma cruzi Dm28c]|uniref:Trans-sialidase n=1 Tax=Trypanosoma cruzi Dm28c TaxID=1416333 RepID=V5AMT8_TRYCR|nr:hypothetical protein TCDM_13567 [Trypanosoma cruzi Dm28c]